MSISKLWACRVFSLSEIQYPNVYLELVLRKVEPNTSDITSWTGDGDELVFVGYQRKEDGFRVTTLDKPLAYLTSKAVANLVANHYATYRGGHNTDLCPSDVIKRRFPAAPVEHYRDIANTLLVMDPLGRPILIYPERLMNILTDELSKLMNSPIWFSSHASHCLFTVAIRRYYPPE